MELEINVCSKLYKSFYFIIPDTDASNKFAHSKKNILMSNMHMVR